MTQNFHVDSASLNRPRSIKLRGVEVEVAPSPYDIPISIKAQVNLDLFRRDIIISIEYLGGGEPAFALDSTEPVILHLGRKTHRLYGIEVLIDRLGGVSKGLAARCSEAVQQAISKLKDRNAGSHRVSNYDVLGQLMHQFGGTIFGPLEPR